MPVFRSAGLMAAGAAALAACALLVATGSLSGRLRGSRRPAEGLAVIRVAVLGDSIVAGSPAGKETAWPAHLSRLLARSYPGADWQVINAGVPGDTAPLGLMRFGEWAPATRPAAILIAFGLNDCHPHRHGLDRWLEGRLPLAEGYPELARLASGPMWRAARRLGLAPAPVPEAVPVPELRTTPQGFSRALEALVDWALAIGARPALVTMPPQAPFAAEAVTVRRPYYDEYNRRIAALGLERDVASAKVGAAGQPIHEADGLHLNGAGQRWLAEVVFEQLDAQGFWRAIGAEAA